MRRDHCPAFTKPLQYTPLMFALTGLKKLYADDQGLQATNLTTPTGRTLAIVGPSGCGKSTLLRLMLGLIPPDAGTVEFHDRPLRQDNLAQRHNIGYVTQGGGLFPHLTARRNVTLLAQHLGWTADRQSHRVEQLRSLTGLSAEMLERFPKQLSGGQQQRVALMRALMLDPDALLLDEPLGALDPLIRADLQRDLREIFRALEKTVILVTHDISEAAALGDEIVLMRNGRIIQRGTFDELRQSPADEFVTRFLSAGRAPLAGKGG